jgi:hypothetical protein
VLARPSRRPLNRDRFIRTRARCVAAPGCKKDNFRAQHHSFDACLKAVLLKYPQSGVPGVMTTSSIVRRFAEFFAQLIGALVENRPR